MVVEPAKTTPTPVKRTAEVAIRYSISGGKWANNTKFKFWIDNKYIGKYTLNDGMISQKTLPIGNYVLSVNDWAGNAASYPFFAQSPNNYTIEMKATAIFDPGKFIFNLLVR